MCDEKEGKIDAKSMDLYNNTLNTTLYPPPLTANTQNNVHTEPQSTSSQSAYSQLYSDTPVTPYTAYLTPNFHPVIPHLPPLSPIQTQQSPLMQMEIDDDGAGGSISARSQGVVNQGGSVELSSINQGGGSGAGGSGGLSSNINQAGGSGGVLPNINQGGGSGAGGSGGVLPNINRGGQLQQHEGSGGISASMEFYKAQVVELAPPAISGNGYSQRDLLNISETGWSPIIGHRVDDTGIIHLKAVFEPLDTDHIEEGIVAWVALSKFQANTRKSAVFVQYAQSQGHKDMNDWQDQLKAIGAEQVQVNVKIKFRVNANESGECTVPFTYKVTTGVKMRSLYKVLGSKAGASNFSLFCDENGQGIKV